MDITYIIPTFHSIIFLKIHVSLNAIMEKNNNIETVYKIFNIINHRLSFSILHFLRFVFFALKLPSTPHYNTLVL